MVCPQDLPSFDEQRSWWNAWVREFLGAPDAEALRRGDTAINLLQSLALSEPRILEVGCGNGWLCEKLIEFGPVTGVDLADEAIREAQHRVPRATFIAGDFCSVELPLSAFDVALTLETLSHVLDQPAFVSRFAAVLKPNGHLILLTQNRLVYSRRSDIAPQGAGQIRRWVTMAELQRMIRPHFDVVRAFTIQPRGHLGFLQVVNSRILNAALLRVMSPRRLEALKERAGLGQTLVVLARRRAAPST